MTNLDKLLVNSTYGKTQTINLNVRNADETKIDRYFRYGMYAILTWAFVTTLRGPRYFG
jgi:hypothetical protein